MKAILSMTLILMLLFMFGAKTSLYAQVSASDSLALVALYDSTNGASWTDNTNWLSGQPVSTWYGITVANNKVTEIDLHSNNLTGVIPSQIGDLDSLTVLFLNYNSLSGPIPIEFGNLTDMLWINFSGNQLSGPIPQQLENMTNLQMLRIDSNDFTGTIPEALGSLTDLEMLIIGYNQLTGTIPDTLGNLTNLQYLWINSCQITGPIPDSFQNLTNLQFLYLDQNQLSGTIPSWIGNLSNLAQLKLDNNQLTGTIPDTLGNLTNLNYLFLDYNQLSGPIPASFGSLSSLRALYLGNNHLSGSIPPEIGNMTSLSSLFLHDNLLTGAVPNEITNLSNLSDLGIENNLLEDLPDLNTLSNLSWLVVQNNRFTFEDIEPNIGAASQSFTYSPQDSVGAGLDTLLNLGDNLTLSVIVGGTANQYQWMKDGVEISGATDSVYIITSASVSDAGEYLCRITNTIATDLTLYCRPFNVVVYDPNGVSEEIAKLPEKFKMFQNYPNPFNPVTQIKFALPKTAQVKLDVFNILGQHITTLLNMKKEAGFHTIQFNANQFASGMYVYTIQADGFYKVKKMLLVK